MRILLISTGGTIGSAMREVIDADRAVSRLLPQLYRLREGADVQFDFLEPFSILSENMTPVRLSVLLQTLAEVDFSAYEGVILTHGSDTLSYTAAFAGLLFGRVGCPIVLTAANRPLEDPRSNGPANFAGAVDLIVSGAVRSGVFAVYRNQEETEVFLATRMLEADGLHEMFSPFGERPLGRMEGARFVPYPSSDGLLISAFADAGTAPKPAVAAFSRPVWMLRQYPGLDYSAFDLSRPPAAVLLIGYHSGTACVEGEGVSFRRFAEALAERGVPVYFLPARGAEEKVYASTAVMLSAGCRPLCRISPESAYAKLCIAYNFYPEMAEKYVQQNVFFEYLGEALSTWPDDRPL